MANDRVYQLPVEAAVSPTDADARINQEPVEVVLSPTTAKARVHQVPVEILVQLPTVSTGAVTADAEIIYTAQGSLSIDALFESTQPGSFTIAAIIKKPWVSVIATHITLSQPNNQQHAWSAEYPVPAGGSLAARIFGSGSHYQAYGGYNGKFGLGAPESDSSWALDWYYRGYFPEGTVGTTVYFNTNVGPGIAWNTSNWTYYTSPVWTVFIFPDWDAPVYFDVYIQWYPVGSTPPDPRGAPQSVFANALIAGLRSATVTANAVISGPQTGSATADAEIRGEVQVITGAFMAAAEIALVWGPWSDTEHNHVDFSFTADATLTEQASDSVTIDSLLQAAATGSFAADACLSRTSTWSATVDSSIAGRVLGSIAADAVLCGTRTVAATANAEIRLAGGDFSADAIVFATRAHSVVADAEIGSASWTETDTFTAEALIATVVTTGITADAWVLAALAGGFSLDAEIAPIRSDLGISWAIAASSALGVSWSIGGDLYNDLGLAWSIGSPISDLPVAWNTGSSVSSDLGASWEVETPVAPPPFVLTTKILVEGVDITVDVDIAKSYWEMAAGANPGTAKVYVLDTDHGASFTTGDELTLDIGELRVWGGYVVGVRRGYAFDVQDTTDAASVPRYWILECSDYNVLFQKRFVVNKASPTDGIPDYNAGTHDDVIIDDLVNDYLYLAGDGISTRRVNYVGTPMEDSKGAPIVPAISWGDAMRKIAVLPGAIFYIDADRVLNYADVDVIDAPFRLSDQPNNTTSFGYRELELTEDGTNLGNDALVWGAALGVSTMTFKRHQDSASITEHGRWQWADYRRDLYKPASVLKRATTYVDGSTQNNRGHKDDAISIRCTVKRPGLRAGMKVHFTCNTHGFVDVMPIRSMRIRFVNRNEALYELELAHYLDEAWNTAEFRNSNAEDPDDDARFDPCNPVEICEEVAVSGLGVAMTSGTYLGGSVTAFTVAGAQVGVTEVDSSTGEVLVSGTLTSDLDDFNRSLSGSWGTSSSGPTWSAYPYVPGGGSLSYGVDGASAWATANNGGELAEAIVSDLVTGEFTMTQRFTVDRIPNSISTDRPEVMIFALTTTGWVDIARLTLVISSVEGYLAIGEDSNNSGSIGAGEATTSNKTDWVAGSAYLVKWERTASVSRMKIWLASASEPVGWDITIATPSTRTVDQAYQLIRKNASTGGSAVTAAIDYIQFSTVTAIDTAIVCYDVCDGSCVEVVVAGITDTFTRTVSDGAGTSDAGLTYDATYPGTVSVDGSRAVLNVTTNTSLSLSGLTLTNPNGVATVQKTTSSTGRVYVEFYGNNVAGPDRVIDLVFYQNIVTIYEYDADPYFSTTTLGWDLDTQTNMRLVLVGEELSAYIWKTSDPEPPTPTLTLTASAGYGAQVFDVFYVGGYSGTFTLYVDGLDIAGLSGSTTTMDCNTYGYNVVGTGDVYRPNHLRQLGWGTEFDGLNCTMASSAIALDRHTEGAKTATPPQMRAAQLDQSGGTDLADAAYAWSHGWSETLSVRYGLSWASFAAKINEGRGAIVQGMYSEVPHPYTAQPSFDGPHAVYVNEFNADGYALVYDPLATGPKWWPSAVLSDYALTFGGGTVNAGFTQDTN